MEDPHFWDNHQSASEVIEQVKGIRELTEPVGKIQREIEDLLVLNELAHEEEDEESLREVAENLQELELSLRRLELRSMLGEPEDSSDAFLSVHAGAGGTESCDWAQMLVRMYSRWAEKENYETVLVESLPGEEAGLKSATLRIAGRWSFGYLKGETGVHRLVRISPFDSSNRRHTSFAAVDVVPDIKDTIQIELNENEIEMEFLKSSGPGGQHVNKTSSAVRLKHIPTGITVVCQSERSQHKNRKIAYSLLKGKLYQHQRRKREKELQQLYDEKGDIAWGNQIRSYVLQPYQLVKDSRTGYQTGNTEQVLDGHLGPFMEAYLRHRLEQKRGGK